MCCNSTSACAMIVCLAHRQLRAVDMKQWVLPTSWYHRQSKYHDRQVVLISLAAVEIFGMREAGGRRMVFNVRDTRFRRSRLTRVRSRNKLYMRANIPYRHVEVDGYFRNTADGHSEAR